MIFSTLFYGVDKKKHYITCVVLVWPRKDKEGLLKAEGVAACQKCYGHCEVAILY